MDQFSRLHHIPSCTLNKSLLVDLEKKIHHNVPKILNKLLFKLTGGLGLSGHEKLESYRVVVEEKKKKSILESARKLPANHFKSRVKQVRLTYRLAAPRILFLEIVFSRNGHSYIRMESQSQHVENSFPQILDTLCGTIEGYANYHKYLHNRLLQALFVLILPLASVVYGYFAGLSMTPLLFSMGWLCLLSLGIVRSLQYLYPWVTFQSKSLVEIHRFPMLASLAILVVVIGFYLTLVVNNLPSLDHTQQTRAVWMAQVPLKK